jgi:hypothetical protein
LEVDVQRVRFVALTLILIHLAVGAFACASGTETTPSASGIDPTGTGGAGGAFATSVGGGGSMTDFDGGTTDGGESCNPGEQRTCFTGPADARAVGACQDGVQYCDTKGEFGTWGECIGEVLPSNEICDDAAADENCDGSENEGCACDGTRPVSCGSDVGECVAGTQTCDGGALGPCVGAVGPSPETCNGLDDDCNGTVDDGLVMNCGSSVGACQPGASTCDNGAWGPCVGAVGATDEICNGADDNCDGQVDEGLTQSCGTDVGACVAGTQTCANGAWGACAGQVAPTNETCNGVDDDCDGDTDEGCQCQNGQTMACGTNTGACTTGTQTCSSGAWGPCVGGVGPTPEICNNVDDDCDGQTDEGLTQSCGTDQGACVAGTQTCSAGVWSACAGSVGPTTETCNNIDDDCDGLKDELLTQQCGTTNVGACEYGTQTCSNGAFGSCVGAINPVPEVCGNGIDDDCDGQADEPADCPQSPPTCTCPPANFTVDPLATVNLSASCSDPDGGAVTYHWTVTQAPAGSSSQPASPNSATTTFFVDLAGDYTITLTVTDNEGQTTQCTVHITAVPPQDLHVELVWNTPYGDADLHLIQAGVNPATAWYFTEPDCFYGNKTGAWPPNGGAGDATLDIDDTDGFGPENINILQSPANGTYEIGVAYYCMHSLQKPGKPNIDPGSGPTSATVKVYCGGALIATYNNISLDKTGRFVDVASVTWPGCAGMSKMTQTWTALVQPPAASVPLHCQLPCGNNNDCGGGEVCQSGVCVLD